MNNEQAKAFDAVIDGSNILLTGPGGAGKTYTINNIVSWAKNNDRSYAVTASTGCAAYLVRGRTIHSFLGIGLGKKSAQELYETARIKYKFILNRLKALDLLIIDEISMIDSVLFSKISAYLSLVRKSSKAFGGVQIVLSGDFAQLPPVEGTYCFHSPDWARANIKTMNLNTLIRQDKDDRFKEILEDARWGKCSKTSLDDLKALKTTKFGHGIIPTILYSTNVNVDNVNNGKFCDLLAKGAAKHSYKTTYSTHKGAKEWAKSIKIPEEIELCEGAQVVLTWNLSQDEGLINGSRGVIKEVTPKGPRVLFNSGALVLIEPLKVMQEDSPGPGLGATSSWVSFVPLKLAYAITVHKSQGMTLDAIVMDLGESIFEYGQAYTALSRAKNLESIRVMDVKASSFKTHKDVLAFYKHD